MFTLLSINSLVNGNYVKDESCELNTEREQGIPTPKN